MNETFRILDAPASLMKAGAVPAATMTLIPPMPLRNVRRVTCTF